MDGRQDFDDEAIWILDRFYAGAMDGVAWPMLDVLPLGPTGAVLAWLRAGARDPRCVWWSVERFGAAETLEALDEVRASDVPGAEDAHAWAVTWLRLVASQAAGFEAEGAPAGRCTPWRHPLGAWVWDWRG